MGARERRKNLMEALRFDQMTDRLWDIKKKHGSTCKWLLKQQKYLSWLNDDDFRRHKGFIWLKGKPGAGKSTIMKFAYENHKMKQSTGEFKSLLVASFFFHARGDHLQKTVEGMFRSLTVQLFEGYPDLQCLLDDSELISSADTVCPSETRVQELFQRYRRPQGSPVCVLYRCA